MKTSRNLIAAFLMLIPFMGFIISCSDKDDEPEVMGTVSITAPDDGAEVSGIVTVSIDVENTDVVDYVEIYIDGQTSDDLKDISAPFAVQWNTAGLAIGSGHTILAKAYSDIADPAVSSFINVTIGSNLEIPTDGLMAYFPFNSEAVDESGNYNLVTVHGAVLTADRNNTPASAYMFNGASYIDFVNPAFFNGMARFTLAAWVNPSVTGVKHYILAKSDPYRDFCLRITDTDAINLLIQPVDLSYPQCGSGAGTILSGEWVHCAAVWTGTHMKIYLDGTLMSDCDHTGLTVPWSGATMRIGSISDQEHFTGAIDEVLIYNRELTAAEIAGLAQL